MITGELKSKVDRVWDTMWSGGISNPLSVIEQLTYMLFIKRLDELHTLEEKKAARTGKPIVEPVFGPKQNRLRWSRFKETAPEVMFETVKNDVFPFIKNLVKEKGDGDPEGLTYNPAKFVIGTPSPSRPSRTVFNATDNIDELEAVFPETTRIVRDTLGKSRDLCQEHVCRSSENSPSLR